MKHRIWPLLAVAWLLQGCLIVDDFGAQWQAARADTCLNPIADALYYQAYQRRLPKGDIAHHARGLTLQDQHFLLLKKHQSDAGGYLYRFDVTGGIYTQFRLAPTMRNVFLAEYPDAPVVIERDTVRLARLDEKTVSLLLTIAQDARYWEKESAHMYNPLHYPHCAFEDRDLRQLESNHD
jgi:hypothetical protein